MGASVGAGVEVGVGLKVGGGMEVGAGAGAGARCQLDGLLEESNNNLVVVLGNILEIPLLFPPSSVMATQM